MTPSRSARARSPRRRPASAHGKAAGPADGNDPVRAIAALFAGEGALAQFGAEVAQAAHMLQAAALAERCAAPPPLLAAALLHDVGHFAEVAAGHQADPDAGRRHGEAGAVWLSQWFGPEVTEPVRLHVAAKRYLCAVEPGYAATLPAASRRTLELQGGPMTDAETAAFEATPYAYESLRVRRWDDAAKDPGLTPPAFVYYQPVLRRLLKPR